MWRHRRVRQGGTLIWIKAPRGGRGESEMELGAKPGRIKCWKGTTMSLKDILVHLDAGPHAEKRLGVAAMLARTHGAHLTGLFVTNPAAVSELMVAGADAVVVDTWIRELRQRNEAEAGQAREVFDAVVAREGISGEWRMAEGPLAQTVTLHTRYADLVVLGQPDPDRPETHMLGSVIEEVMFSAGRPLLMVPYAGTFETIGRNVLVGWNATREATRALNDAMPLMAAAEKVTVVAADPSGGVTGEGDVPAADIAIHLARHGLKVVASHTVSDGLDGGDILLNTATDIGADLLVMGAYGHSRVRELVLGGATRSVLQHATLPVLMAR